MNIVKRFIGNLLFPGTVRFIDNLSTAAVQSVKEIENFDMDVKSLCTTWLGICPYTYFCGLFMENEKWNAPFVRAFTRSDMVNAQLCYRLTQAFYLKHLFRIINHDENYRKYSQDTIIQNMLSHMNMGSEILAWASDYEKAIENMTSVEDFSMHYVEKVLQTQYSDKNTLDSVLNSIWLESFSLLGLTQFTTESIRRAKYIDSQKSLDSGYAEAQYNIDMGNDMGEGVPQDYKGAANWYTTAAKQGDVEAQFNLGMTHYLGEGIPQDYEEAFKWITKAAEQGKAKAQTILGLMYIKGEGVPQDYKKAVKWVTKAAEQGDVEAQFNLGLTYYMGEGVPRDYKEAVKWYTKAAEQEDAEAQCTLGLMYVKGKGVPQDYEKAVKWIKKAAEQGYAIGQYSLGLMYYMGEGVPRDYVKAYKWLNLAVAGGLESASTTLDTLTEAMSPDQVAEAQRLSREIYLRMEAADK